MKRKSFSVLFFLRKKKLLKNGEAPVCMRITADRSMCDIQIKRSIAVELWDQSKERSKGRGQEAYELNLYIESIRSKIYQIHRELETDGKTVNAETIKNKFYGIDSDNKTLLQVFTEHNNEARSLIGKGYVDKTVQRFETTARYLSEFIKAEYNLSDIALKELDLAFIRKFDVFLKVEKNCAQNSAITRLKNLKKITRIAFSNDWMQKDPFVTYRFKFDETDPEFLTLYIDYTQFEAGILASLSEEDSLIRLYDSDIYLDFAKCILKNDNRQEAKIYFYRYMYGDTTLNPTILKYFNKYTKLKKFHELIETELIENKKIGTCDGNFRLILEEDNYHWALSHKIQATASLIFKQALIKVEKEVPEADFLIPMHDGAVYQVDLARYNLSKIKIEKIFTDSFKKICPNIIPRVHTQSTFE